MVVVRYAVFALVALVIGMTAAPVAYAAEGPSCPKQSFFALPTWHKYLPVDQEKTNLSGSCEVKFSLMDPVSGKFNGSGILLIGLAIIDIVTRAAGLVAFGFIVYGGFRYIMSQGSPENTKAALSTIINAAIGLIVALLAAAIVSFVGFSIG